MMMKTPTKPRPRSADISYHQAHQRVRDDRGPARGYECAEDGCDQQAEQWAYNHQARRPLHGWSTGQCPSWMTYSADPSDYLPFCRWHHCQFDKAHRRRAVAERLRAANEDARAARAVA